MQIFILLLTIIIGGCHSARDANFFRASTYAEVCKNEVILPNQDYGHESLQVITNCHRVHFSIALSCRQYIRIMTECAGGDAHAEELVKKLMQCHARRNGIAQWNN